MKAPQDISIKDYTYELPVSRIAQFPLDNRDQSKLLVNYNGTTKETLFCEIDKHIPPKSLLIFNDTKVVQARLIFKKASGALIELFCLEPYDFRGDIAQGLLQKGMCEWKCFVGNLKKWKSETLEKTIKLNNYTIVLYAEKIKQENDSVIVLLKWKPETLTFAEILENVGQIPLPPYITRDLSEKDKQRYQTVYANFVGSVAAPTAGLHFTEEVFERLAKNSISRQNVTLHVGAGTFKPVSSQKMKDHRMHSEQISVHIKLVEHLLKNINQPTICVGTTSVRTIESLYWFGVKLLTEKTDHFEINISQWEPYDTNASIEISPEESLHAIIDFLKVNKLKTLTGSTQVIICPGYEFKLVNGIITNFHQPQSTLLLLIAAFLGNSWRDIYQYALNNNFRFLSYGDCCLFLKNTQ